MLCNMAKWFTYQVRNANALKEKKHTVTTVLAALISDCDANFRNVFSPDTAKVIQKKNFPQRCRLKVNFKQSHILNRQLSRSCEDQLRFLDVTFNAV